MIRLALVALIGCGGAPRSAAPEPIANSVQPVESPHTLPMGNCTLAGTVLDPITSDLLAGSTIVVSGGDQEPSMTISENQGVFELTAARGHDRLNVYYADAAGEAPLDAGLCGVRIRVGISTTRSSDVTQRLQITIVGR